MTFMFVTNALPYNLFSWIPVGEVYDPVMPMEQDVLWEVFQQALKD